MNRLNVALNNAAPAPAQSAPPAARPTSSNPPAPAQRDAFVPSESVDDLKILSRKDILAQFQANPAGLFARVDNDPKRLNDANKSFVQQGGAQHPEPTVVNVLGNEYGKLKSKGQNELDRQLKAAHAGTYEAEKQEDQKAGQADAGAWAKENPYADAGTVQDRAQMFQALRTGQRLGTPQALQSANRVYVGVVGGQNLYGANYDFTH